MSFFSLYATDKIQVTQIVKDSFVCQVGVLNSWTADDVAFLVFYKSIIIRTTAQKHKEYKNQT